MRLAVYGGVSSLLAAAVIMSAMHKRSNFYSACVYLYMSNLCILILLNLGLFITIVLGKTLQAIFFGDLRPIEVEHLYERSWYAVTETCLAMTIFRDDFDLRFVLLFTTLLFLKIFHWLCHDRVEFMEQSPAVSPTFHIRMVNLMAILVAVDSSLAAYAISTTMKQGPNMLIMFGFEYTILTGSVLSILVRYAISIYDMSNEEPWENKSIYVFYLDLVTEFFKLVTYLVFFFFICYFYQLPIHIIRDVYVTSRSFFQKCRDLYRYRRATRNMDERFPTATADELSAASDSTCIICREDMQPSETSDAAGRDMRQEREGHLDQPRRLPCGHIFHFRCLRSWLERQQSCPTCRRTLLSDNAQNTSGQGDQPPMERNPIHAEQNHGNPRQQLAPNQHPQPTYPSQQQQQTYHHSTDPYSNTDSRPSYSSAPTPSTTIPQFNILTPEHDHPSIISTDGMIPLVPLSRYAHGSTDQPLPTSSNLPLSLTDDQIRELSTVSREAIVQRLHILELVQNQIFHSMELLTQVLSVTPSHHSPNTRERETPVDHPVEHSAERSRFPEDNISDMNPYGEGSSRSYRANAMDSDDDEMLE